MPALSEGRRRASARVGALSKHRLDPEDPALADARRDLRAEEAAECAEHIRRLVDTFPPLSAEQRTKIAALLRPVVAGEGERAALTRRRLTIDNLTSPPAKHEDGAA